MSVKDPRTKGGSARSSARSPRDEPYSARLNIDPSEKSECWLSSACRFVISRHTITSICHEIPEGKTKCLPLYDESQLDQRQKAVILVESVVTCLWMSCYCLGIRKWPLTFTLLAISPTSFLSTMIMRSWSVSMSSSSRKMLKKFHLPGRIDEVLSIISCCGFVIYCAGHDDLKYIGPALVVWLASMALELFFLVFRGIGENACRHRRRTECYGTMRRSRFRIRTAQIQRERRYAAQLYQKVDV